MKKGRGSRMSDSEDGGNHTALCEEQEAVRLTSKITHQYFSRPYLHCLEPVEEKKYQRQPCTYQYMEIRLHLTSVVAAVLQASRGACVVFYNHHCWIPSLMKLTSAGIPCCAFAPVPFADGECFCGDFETHANTIPHRHYRR